MLYIYFIRIDAQFPGETILMQLQSALLAIAGFLSVYSWHYSIKNNLISETPTEEEKKNMFLKFLPEPIVSLITFPLAWFGSIAWTLGWLMLIPIGWALKKYRQRLKFLAINEELEKEL
jgi:hypothetical protein